jgi:magnesium chelatase subunit D
VKAIGGTELAMALQNPLSRGLAAAALHPGLRSLLVFDAAPTMLQIMAGQLAQMVAAVTGTEIALPEAEAGSEARIKLVQLGAVETEEELWGSLTLGQAASSIVWRSGLLAAAEPEIRIVVIPDLTRLSLAASRACVMLMGAEVAHLERHGQQDCWQPQLYWLAGCDQTRIGALSTHLLDRFALRLNGGESQYSEQRIVQLRGWLAQLEAGSPERLGVDVPQLAAAVVSLLQQVKHSCPQVLPEARERVLDYLDGYSTRRDLALLRLAKVDAQLERAEQVRRDNVDRAAAVIGLPLKQQRPEKRPDDPVKPELAADAAQSQPVRQDSDASNLPRREATPPSIHHEPVFESDATQMPSTPLPMGKTINPYLEDTAEPERSAASLRLPLRRFKSASSGRGAIIGIEPATVPQDLAIVSTLLEAAKYQKLRWKALLERQDLPEGMQRLLSKRNEQGHGLLILQPGDLRRYRRAMVPEQMLTLVMDYTCLRECQWQAALLPYLQWAYVERSSVCLVQVGAANAAQELQAEKIVAQNVLVSRISSGLEVGGGQATPLAHGLDLALQTLRHALQHGRSVVRQAVLVVISDGRGNVPLVASRTNQKPGKPVNRQGIEDALQVAQQIAGLKQVEAVVLNPQPKYYANLPVQLAQALGAKIAAIPLLKAWEVDE